MKYSILAAACGALIFCAPAQAAVTVGDFTIEEGSFGAGTGVHSTGAQTGTTINGVVNQEGSAVTFTSTDSLTINGSGQAIISPVDGIMTDLTVLFANPWAQITFSFDGDPGSFSLLVNDTANFGTCSICNISSSGQNKFTVSGGDITKLGFTFNPGVSTARQFRVEQVNGAVPEPGTWAMMLLGFGAIGFAMRRRRQTSGDRIRVRFAF